MNKNRIEWVNRRLELNARLDEVIIKMNGGPGSGYKNHPGRPGLRGGSSKTKQGVGINSWKNSGKIKGYQTSVGTGVDGEQSYGTGLRSIPRLSDSGVSLTKEQQALEEEICAVYENEASLNKAIAAADGYMQGKLKAEKDAGDNARLTYETDAIKQALPGWGTDDRYNLLKNKTNLTEAEQKEFETYRKNRQENNTLYHNTANAIAKAAFERKVQSSKATKDDYIIVTAGGCGSGKGFGLGEIAKGGGILKDKTGGKAISQFSEQYGKASIVWDAAGDQCSSELKWITKLAQANNKKVVVLQTNNTNDDPYSQIANNQIKRANKEGRMVASKVSGQSYELGNKNIEVFAKSTYAKDVTFYTIDNSGVIGNDVFIRQGLSTNQIDGNKMSTTIQNITKSSEQSNSSIIKGAEFLGI